jgi:hypothetical protein
MLCGFEVGLYKVWDQKMNAQKAFAWFTTEHGKRFVFGGVCCLAIGIPSTNFLSHTFLLNKYKEIVQMYG